MDMQEKSPCKFKNWLINAVEVLNKIKGLPYGQLSFKRVVRKWAQNAISGQYIMSISELQGVRQLTSSKNWTT